MSPHMASKSRPGPNRAGTEAVNPRIVSAVVWRDQSAEIAQPKHSGSTRNLKVIRWPATVWVPDPSHRHVPHRVPRSSWWTCHVPSGKVEHRHRGGVLREEPCPLLEGMMG